MLLSLKDISFKYDKKDNFIIKNLNLDIENMEIVGLVGESGSGKSTLLRIIAGLEEINSGSILLENSVISSQKIHILPEKRKIGMIFQDYGLFPHLNVYNNIAFGLFNLKKDEKKNRIEDMLKIIKMQDYKKRYPFQLSGGQQQRVALARALAPKPKILLMDEPFSNLDAMLKKDIRKDVLFILKSEKVTSILVSHDIVDIDEICSRKIDLNTNYNN